MNRKRERDDVYAVQGGKVLWCLKTPSSYGYRIYIEHEDGTKAMYAHLSNFHCREGDILEEGTLIGTIGNSGYSLNDSGKHLHISYFSKRVKELTAKWAQDPTFWIKLHTYPTNTKVTNPYRSNRYNKTIKNKDGTQKLTFHEGIDLSYQHLLDDYQNGIDALYQDYLLQKKYPEYYD